jgi:hypothetical protein
MTLPDEPRSAPANHQVFLISPILDYGAVMLQPAGRVGPHAEPV